MLSIWCRGVGTSKRNEQCFRCLFYIVLDKWHSLCRIHICSRVIHTSEPADQYGKHLTLIPWSVTAGSIMCLMYDARDLHAQSEVFDPPSPFLHVLLCILKYTSIFVMDSSRQWRHRVRKPLELITRSVTAGVLCLMYLVRGLHNGSACSVFHCVNS